MNRENIGFIQIFWYELPAVLSGTVEKYEKANPTVQIPDRAAQSRHEVQLEKQKRKSQLHSSLR